VRKQNCSSFASFGFERRLPEKKSGQAVRVCPDSYRDAAMWVELPLSISHCPKRAKAGRKQQNKFSQIFTYLSKS